MGSKQLLPQARTDKLVVQTLPNETLVYDLESNKAHCLNEAAALVWKNCDGQMTVSKMTTILEEKMKVPVDQGVVLFALGRLEKAELLRDPIARGARSVSMSRRDVVKTLGIGAAVSAPLVFSIVAPDAAQAVSCIAAGQPCFTGGPQNCCPGLQCTSQDQTHKACQ